MLYLVLQRTQLTEVSRRQGMYSLARNVFLSQFLSILDFKVVSDAFLMLLSMIINCILKALISTVFLRISWFPVFGGGSSGVYLSRRPIEVKISLKRFSILLSEACWLKRTETTSILKMIVPFLLASCMIWIIGFLTSLTDIPLDPLY